MAVYNCGGWSCPRMISVSAVPGGNPVALRDPEHFAVLYSTCEDCKHMFCDRHASGKSGLFGKPRCPDCRGKLLKQATPETAASRPWPEPVRLYNEGYRLGTGGDIAAALAHYDRAVQLRSDYVLAHYRRGLTLRDLGRYDEALVALDRAARLDPGHVLALFDTAAIHLGRRRWDAAVHALDRAIAAQPRYVAAHINRAFALLALGRAQDALAGSEEAIRLEESGSGLGMTPHASAIAHRAKGAALMKLQRYPEALAALDVAVDTGPDDRNTYRNRATVLERLGRHEEAQNDHRLAERFGGR